MGDKIGAFFVKVIAIPALMFIAFFAVTGGIIGIKWHDFSGLSYVYIAVYAISLFASVIFLHPLFFAEKKSSMQNSNSPKPINHSTNSDTELKKYEVLALQKAQELREKAEADERERQRREQEEADERAFWNSPEGRRLRAERELAEIRSRERKEAEEMARRIAEEEHKRQQEALKTLKDL